mmetsp:Transcript_7187/g.10532  ORF Transcript_7187/g.10532 Transcript_7187/m.10532 type:complete len:195 (-) Transcript_7187:77-661(-)
MNEAQQGSTVVSASSEASVGSDGDDEPHHERDRPSRTPEAANDFYGSEMDDEDEAWVYRNLRGGVEESVTIISQDDNGQPVRKTIKALKPRTSDAVLSCPCCLQTVCMDCQKHERYDNQFRAMFVMNIGVDWEKILMYSEGEKSLVERTDETTNGADASDEIYYSVHCGNCKTSVAALDMRDEVYHFFGCVASS